MKTKVIKYRNPFSYKLIYVFRINDELHKGALKIGEATIKYDGDPADLTPSCKELNTAARPRINQYTQTAGLTYDLLHTELAFYENSKGNKKAFNDKRVHKVLTNSGIKQAKLANSKEWFYTDLQTAKNAISAVKAEKASLTGKQISQDKNPIILRPSQEEAITKTVKRFSSKANDKMLWNAKMRFGKTLAAFEVVRRMNFKKTLILTHRPVVSQGWFDDYKLVFSDTDNWRYGQKNAQTIKELIKSKDDNFIYFASIQDLRGSSAVGGKFDKNDEVFNTDWDMLIVDEAHEGTKTSLAQDVFALLKKKNTKTLQLSGTPFNLLSEYSDEETYTWDYTAEQEAKANWARLNACDSNPYEDLPSMQIYTFDLAKQFERFQDSEKSFNFREFFRVWTGDPMRDGKQMPANTEVGSFVYEADIKAFLNLISKKSDDSNYPFANEEFREYFNHTLWMVPGVKEAKALSSLLKAHPIFSSFEIVNVAGEGDEEQPYDDALDLVRKAINKNQYTITLSCGKLTTGVSVPEWTGVLMLAGSYSTSAASYLQTIFRVQTPAIIEGRMKEVCYVFDFAPDRTLKMMSDAVNLSTKAGRSTEKSRKAMGRLLNFCPIIAVEGTGMREYEVSQLLEQLKRVYIDKVCVNGFDDSRLYNFNIPELTAEDKKMLEHLQSVSKASNQMKKPEEVKVNDQGFVEEDFDTPDDPDTEPKPKKTLTPEEIERRKKILEERKRRKSLISNLRGISIRIPLLIYGANIPYEKDITIDNFTKLVDDVSWEEFMPKGFTKANFNYFTKFYDPEIFIGAGRRIRQRVMDAENLPIVERVQKIAKIFATFRNPDKETVLTPWRVVNMHMSDTLGGYDFYDEKHEELLDMPRIVDHGDVTAETLWNTKAKVLEINSKTGLYPLFVAYSMFCARRQQKQNKSQESLWEETLRENIFVICKTPMAEYITKRTLAGFKNIQVNAKYIDNLVNKAQDEKTRKNLVKLIQNGKTFWNINKDTDMKFDAIVGNPPYTEITAKKDTNNGQKRQKNIFQYFQQIADDLGATSSLVYPGARWIHRSGKNMEDFGKTQINDEHLNLLIYYPDWTELFPTAQIGDGISIVLKLRDKKKFGFKYVYKQKEEEHSVFIKEKPGNNLIPLNPVNSYIIEKINGAMLNYSMSPLAVSVLPQKLFGIESSFVELNPKKVRPYNKGDNFDVQNEIKLFTNDKAGKAGRSQWYIAKRNIIHKDAQKYIDRWKVVVSSANAGGQKRSNQIAIMDNHTAFGRSRVALKDFATKEEAQNFFRYAQSTFIRFAFLLTDESLTSLAKWVPDLNNYKNNNGLVDFSADINTEVYKLFNISEKYQKYINDYIAKIDLARGK